jgi:TM2 domain-containing membrane protein YozV
MHWIAIILWTCFIMSIVSPVQTNDRDYDGVTTVGSANG